MDYIVTPNNVHIVDSWTYSKHSFRSRLEFIQEDYPECLVFQYRCNWHMRMEWATHNFLYKIGLWQDRTGSVDLNWPQKWYMAVAYAVAGPISWLFIR